MKKLSKAKYRQLKKSLIEIRGKSCENCGLSFTEDSAFYGLDCDHIINRSQGGADEAWNLQLLCRSCHVKKTVGKFTVGKFHKTHPRLAEELEKKK